MMQMYLKTKEEYSDCILFYRLGDFYEMFFDDAIKVSKELELTLTGKNCGMEERAPMCGVPYHAADVYLNRLVQKGYKVAICEQVEDPKLAKGLVKREVIRVVTPGTITSTTALDETKNNYLLCIVYFGDAYGVAAVDVTTGDFHVTELKSAKALYDEIVMYAPPEIISNEAFLLSGVDLTEYKNKYNLQMGVIDDFYFDDDTVENVILSHFGVKKMDALGLTDFPAGTVAAGALLKYLYDTQKNSLTHITTIHPYISGKYLMIDGASRRNLELVETMREKNKIGSLLHTLDKTKTAMGARMLRQFVEQPLTDIDLINTRLSMIEEFNSNVINRDELREYLNPIYDLERLVGKITYETANPRDLVAFKTSIEMIPGIKCLLNDFKCKAFSDLNDDMDSLRDLFELIDAAISEDAPITLNEGKIIKEGYMEEIDKLRVAKTEGKNWMADLVEKEKERTGIKNLKIGFNKVFGYYIEVSNGNLSNVPDYFIRKQTLTNGERFITPELKELEDTILSSEEHLIALEYRIFTDIRQKISSEVKRIHKTAKAIAMLDAIASLAYVADKNNYVKPNVNNDGVIEIKDGRHPVVERMISGNLFVPNDTYLDNKKNRIAIITGPNMAGKSTYMRQTALICLMAQMGSYVPASYANIGIVDHIFTRVGASDDLASGQSTFMVEMTEVANILRNATSNSLILLDEIGRGTSTYDGLSIAWAVVEHISDPKILGAKTLFATHYHELTELEGRLDNVSNYCIAVKENGDDIVFLRKIVKGGADKSYGIQVARLAGVPESVIERAKEIANSLADSDVALNTDKITEIKKPKDDVIYGEPEQLSLFDLGFENPVINEIRNLDTNNMTPMDALNKLVELKKKL
ncbi:MAG: DNA mismatch repair protein MutS [Lachnospiraceae bacterium]|nr:DNA mismatch repair protein MutS [Lachnospiraceae bacterium]MBO4462069.1 DNA mismatch repair protein MutS [Lachnospiraceae bacterium]